MNLNRVAAVVFLAFGLAGVAAAQTSTTQPNPPALSSGGLLGNPALTSPAAPSILPPRPPLRPDPIPAPGLPPPAPVDALQPAPPNILRPEGSRLQQESTQGEITRSLGSQKQ